MIEGRQRSTAAPRWGRWHGATVVSLMVVLACEWFTPLGFAHGLLYVPVLMIAASSRDVRLVRAAGLASVLLIGLGVLVSPPAPPSTPAELVMMNRIGSAFAVLIAMQLAVGLVGALARAEARRLEQERLAHQLADQNRLLRIGGVAGSLGAWSLKLTDSHVEWSDEICRILGVPSGHRPSLEEAIGFYPEESAGRIRGLLAHCVADGTPFDLELAIVDVQGERHWVRVIGHAVRDDGGAITAVEGALQDLTEQQRMRERLRDSESRFLELAEAMPLIVWTAQPNGQLDFISAAFDRYPGTRPGSDGLGAHWQEAVHPDDRPLAINAWRRAVQSGEDYSQEFRLRQRDDSYRWYLSRATAAHDAEGAVHRWYGSAIDIHDNREMREEARRLTQRLTSTLESISDAFFLVDGNWRLLYINSRAEQLLQRHRSELLGRSLWEAFPDSATEQFGAEYRKAATTRRAVSFTSYFPPLERWFDTHAYPTEEGLAVYIQDVTRRLELEKQLRRTQRLESIGQLTGGIAHDFNNLLTVILGNADLLSDSLARQDDLRGLADMISSAAQRGADLTQRLLAFARRQALEPRATDVGALLSGMSTLLRRALGEPVSIELRPADGLWPAMVDPAQLESAVLNLCLNARDAMEGGGQLSIAANNEHLAEGRFSTYPDFEPGDYVHIAITDTGCGISGDALPHVFEPFYTTKGTDKGTGLGLSMVYGFVRQSRGHVDIESELGVGTTVHMYLPRSDSQSQPPPAAEVGAAPGGSESILLVEDDQLVRRFAHGQLLALGYRVIETSNGAEALEVLQGPEEIDLLFTDVLMPGGMDGRALADAAARLRPGLKVLYTSGYSEATIVHDGRLDAGLLLLHKPYRRDDLARQVRTALNAPAAAAQ